MATAERTLTRKLDFDSVSVDPDFLSLDFAEQRKVLLEIDSEFAALPVEEQFKVITGVNQPKEQRGFLSGVSERLKQLGGGLLELGKSPQVLPTPGLDISGGIVTLLQTQSPRQALRTLAGSEEIERLQKEGLTFPELIAAGLGLPAEEVREALREGEVARAAGLIAPDVALLGAVPFARRLGLRGKAPVKPTPSPPIAPTSRQLPPARIQVPIQSAGEVSLGQIRTTAQRPVTVGKKQLLKTVSGEQAETVSKIRAETGLVTETRGVLVTSPERAGQIVAQTRKSLFTRRGTLRAKEAKRFSLRERVELERTFKQLEQEVQAALPPAKFRQGKFFGGLIRQAATETPELAAATVDRLPVGALNSPTLVSILEEFPTLRKTVPSAGETVLSKAVRRRFGSLQNSKVLGKPLLGYFRTEIQALRQQGVTATQFAERLEFHLSNSAFSVGPWKARLANIAQGLSEAEQRNLVQVVRGKSRSLSATLNTKAAELRKIFSEVREEAIKRKVEIQTSEGRFIPFSAVPDNPIYFPQKIKPEFFGRGIEAAAKKMVSHGSAPDLATAERTLQKFVYPRSVRIAGNIEKAKTFDLPDDLLRLDLSAADEYLSQVGETFSRTEVFGQRPNRFLSQVEKAIAREGGDATIARQVSDRVLRLSQDHLVESTMQGVRALKSAAVYSFLGLAQIPNMSQAINSALLTNTRTFLRALNRVRANPEQARFLARRSGALTAEIQREVSKRLGAVSSGAEKFLEKTQFFKGDTWGRVIANSAGRAHAQEMFQLLLENPQNPFARRMLSKLGLDADLLLRRGTILESELDLAGKLISDRTQFLGNQVFMPAALNEGTLGQLASIFKNYAINQGRLLKEGLVLEALRGNFRPWIPFVTIFPIAGTIVRFAVESVVEGPRILVGVLNGNNSIEDLPIIEDIKSIESIKDIILLAADHIGYVGGIGVAGNLLESTAMGKFAEAIGGPILSTAGRLGQATITGIDKFIVKEEELQEAFRTLERNLVKRIPLVGRPLEGLLFPEEREAVLERKRRQREEGLLDRLLEDLIEED